MSINIDWDNVIKKEARGLNDFDLGEIQEVSNGLILTQKGIVNKEIFSFPISEVESFDGKVLIMHISEKDAENKFKKFIENEQGEVDSSNDVSTTNDLILISEEHKIDAVVDDSVCDSLKEVLTSPTAEELGLENKIEKELSALSEEPVKSNGNRLMLESNEIKGNTARLEDAIQLEDKTSKESGKRESPLKKEDAGIS